MVWSGLVGVTAHEGGVIRSSKETVPLCFTAGTSAAAAYLCYWSLHLKLKLKLKQMLICVTWLKLNHATRKSKGGNTLVELV